MIKDILAIIGLISLILFFVYVIIWGVMIYFDKQIHK